MGVHTLGRALVNNSGYDSWWSVPRHARLFSNLAFVGHGDGPSKIRESSHPPSTGKSRCPFLGLFRGPGSGDWLRPRSCPDEIQTEGLSGTNRTRWKPPCGLVSVSVVRGGSRQGVLRVACDKEQYLGRKSDSANNGRMLDTDFCLDYSHQGHPSTQGTPTVALGWVLRPRVAAFIPSADAQGRPFLGVQR